MTDDNGTSVTQREFGRLIEEIRNDFKEVKFSISKLHEKVDSNSKHVAEMHQTSMAVQRLELQVEALNQKVSNVTEYELPSLKTNNAVTSTKTKVMWGLFISAISTGVTIIVTIVKSFIGL